MILVENLCLFHNQSWMKKLQMNQHITLGRYDQSLTSEESLLVFHVLPELMTSRQRGSFWDFMNAFGMLEYKMSRTS